MVDLVLSDIRQCDVDNGGCDVDNGMCVEETGGLPGYHCECNQGYILFTEAGPHHGHSIPASETGYQYGDVYYFDHTCISKCLFHSFCDFLHIGYEKVFL